MISEITVVFSVKGEIVNFFENLSVNNLRKELSDLRNLSTFRIRNIKHTLIAMLFCGPSLTAHAINLTTCLNKQA
jgi:hypothetical protein